MLAWQQTAQLASYAVRVQDEVSTWSPSCQLPHLPFCVYQGPP
jgi:hypothetical protein